MQGKLILAAKGLFVLAGVYLITSCAIDPVSGKRELMLISEESEIQLGRQTDSQVITQYGIYEEPQLSEYVNQIGQKLAGLSHRPNLSYQFKVLDTSVVNAFAVPGGYVYFTRGILAYLNSEAELAGVMGHEIGHITARHSAEQYSRAQLAQVGLGVGMIFSETFRAFSDLADFGVGMLFLSFSRENEREADDLGVEYASKAGYEADQLANFFETLERMHPGSDRSGLPTWFSTHPNPKDRVKVVRTRAKEWQGKLNLPGYEIRNKAYLKRIDGLIFGEDPRQGYVEEDVFYHPDLRFQFPVPANWRLLNTPAAVQIISERKDALIHFTFSRDHSPKEAAQNFVAKTGASVVEADRETVNGLSAYRLITLVKSQQGTVQLLSYFIEKDKRIYVFQGMSSVQGFDHYYPVFKHTMANFKNLRDRKKLNVKPSRIRIVSPRKSETLRKVLLAFKVPEDDLQEVATLNGKRLEDKIPAKTLIKIIQKGG
jgi:predicted Zn-dependent protease